MSRILVGLCLAVVTPFTLQAQAEPDRFAPRPPEMLDAPEAQRVQAVMQLFLFEFIAAIQRADTLALETLVPEHVIPGAERAVAGAAGCATVTVAVTDARDFRAPRNPRSHAPLSTMHLDRPTIYGVTNWRNGTRVEVKLRETIRGRPVFAPLVLHFGERDDRLTLMQADGVLVGLCGLAREARNAP